MIELLIDWLDKEIKQREKTILHGAITDIVVYRVVKSEYHTLVAIREKAAQFAASGTDEDETE